MGQKDLLKAAAEKSIDQLTCRAVLGHRWNENKGGVKSDGGFYFWRVPCDRCDTVRILKITGDGYRDGNSYVYSDGYIFEGFGHLTKDDLAALRSYVMRAIA